MALTAFPKHISAMTWRYRLSPDEARIHFALGQLLVVEKRFPRRSRISKRYCEPTRGSPKRITNWRNIVACDDLTCTRSIIGRRSPFVRNSPPWNAFGMLRMKQSQSEEAIELLPRSRPSSPRRYQCAGAISNKHCVTDRSRGIGPGAERRREHGQMSCRRDTHQGRIPNP